MESLIALDRRTPVMRWRDVRDESSLWGDLRPELAGAVSVILHATGEGLWSIRGAAPRSRLRTSSVTHAARRPVRFGRRSRLYHHHLRRNTALRPHAAPQYGTNPMAGLHVLAGGLVAIASAWLPWINDRSGPFNLKPIDAT